MILADMPFPGVISRGVQLRQEAQRAISYAETMAQMSPGSDTPEVLRQFFLDCAALLSKTKAKPAKKETT